MKKPTRRGFLGALAGIGAAGIAGLRIDASVAVAEMKTIGSEEVEMVGPQCTLNGRPFVFRNLETFNRRALEEVHTLGGGMHPPIRGRNTDTAKIEFYPGRWNAYELNETLTSEDEMEVVIPPFGRGHMNTLTMRGWVRSWAQNVSGSDELLVTMELLVQTWEWS